VKESASSEKSLVPAFDMHSSVVVVASCLGASMVLPPTSPPLPSLIQGVGGAMSPRTSATAAALSAVPGRGDGGNRHLPTGGGVAETLLGFAIARLIISAIGGVLPALALLLASNFGTSSFGRHKS
jgi:hypothetical protein